VKPVLRPELRYRRLWLFAGLLLAAGIAVLSLMPSTQLPEVRLSDKVQHVLAYVALGFWFGSVVVRRDMIWVALSLLAFGAAIELAQGWMSLGRQADFYDLWSNALGIGIGLLLAITPMGRFAPWLEARLTGTRA
jgi:VanZ family protein